jgi:DNA-binding transcriptional LysR family regulator
MGINLDLTSMRYFVHVASAGSFARGAARAHVSPPAISKAIRKLETELGVRLFERTTRRVALTAAGQRALERCRRILDDVDHLGADLGGGSERPAGPLRIGAMEVFSIELLPAAIADVVSIHPEVVPLSYEMIPQRMIERLVAGELDVGFTIGASPLPGMAMRPLGTSSGVLVCGRRHPLASKRRVGPRDLQEHASVVPRFFGLEHLPSLDQFPDDRYPRRVGATIELLQMAVELVARGRYLGYFPEISVRSHLRSGRLRALRGVTGAEPFRLHAMHRAGASPPPAAEVLIDRVGALVASDRPRARRAR